MPCESVNKTTCPCTCSCSYHGRCCACVANHAPNEFPACFFSKEGELLYDRSFEALVNDRK